MYCWVTVVYQELLALLTDIIKCPECNRSAQEQKIRLYDKDRLGGELKKRKTQENLSFDFLSGLTRKKLVLFFDHIYLFRKPACLMTEKLQLKVNLPVVKTC